MEPRPQKPRPPAGQPGAHPQPQQPTTPVVGPDPSQVGQAAPPQGYDPAAFIAPPRNDYDYSPLDLQPPGQRRKRQIIAGIIGALVVIAVGALIVAGWMAMRDDDGDKDKIAPTPPDRVAQLTSTPTTEPSNTDGSTGENTPAADVQKTPVPTAPPEPTQPAGRVFDSGSIRGVLPPVTSLPEGFTDGGDTPADLPTVAGQLTCTSDPTAMLEELGWQAAMTRSFSSSDPALTGTTVINVSAHAFKDAPSAEQAVQEYGDILECFGWTKSDGEPIGGATQYLTWTNPETGDSAVTIYFTDGQVLYRVFASGPADFDSTPNAVSVARRILGQ